MIFDVREDDVIRIHGVGTRAGVVVGSVNAADIVKRIAVEPEGFTFNAEPVNAFACQCEVSCRQALRCLRCGGLVR